MFLRVFVASAVISCSLLAAPIPVIADSECADCLNRKTQICASECHLVPPQNAISCQKECLEQYCVHRCPKPEPEMISALLEGQCEHCLDTQFNLCSSDCATGTDRARAICKLDCAKTRCSQTCSKQ